MSTTIDQKVVEMRFDNKQFESNVSTSMSTLDKLKQKLNFNGASKGLENIGAAAKNVNMSGLANGVETVRTKFSALEVMGVTALVNITNQAVNAGKRIVSALTIKPVTTGLQEYETQINAVQTIMANVSQKGKTLEDVNNALEELNEYADLTIYNFTEMTRNIGLFTNAGVGLDESVAAIKGFSNAAAMAGTDATRTAGAMYQLSQAMSSGRVLLQDWRSLEQANITGERFQETIKMTARAHGIAIDDMIKKEGSLRDTLSSGWLTADLMSEALNHYTLSLETMTEEEITANKERLRSLGYTEEQITKLFELGTEATNAATKVKTFSQMWGVLQETAQSGWAKTWQIIFGDFEQAKALFTPLTDTLSKIIKNSAEARNKLLEAVLGSRFGKLAEKIKTVTGVTNKMTDAASTVSNSLKDINEVVDEVINGKWGTYQERWNALAEAGYNWAEVQNKVNEELGSSVRYSLELGESQRKLNKVEESTVETQEVKLKQLLEMEDAQLKTLGFAQDEIEALRDLEKQAEKAGIPLEDVLEDLSLLDGRTLLINSFKNIGEAIATTFRTIKEAWRKTFDPILTEDRLYNIIAALHKFTTKLKMSDDDIEKLKTTFKGLFAFLDIVLTLVAGPLKIAFNIISQLLSAFNLNILDATSYVANLIIKFRVWLNETLNFTAIFEALVPYVKMAGEAIRGWIDAIKESQFIKDLTEYLKNSAKAFADWIAGIKDAENIPQYILEGLINGLRSGATAVWNAIIAIGTGIINKICEVLGIHSPSKIFIAIGLAIVAGLVLGLQNGFGNIWETVKGMGQTCVDAVRNFDWNTVWEPVKNAALACADFLKNINWGSVFAAGMGVGALVGVYKLINIVDKFAAPFEGLGNMLSGLGDMFTGLGKRFKAKAWKAKTDAIYNIAKAIGVLAISLFLVSKIDPDRLLGAVLAITTMMTVMIALSLAGSKMKGADFSFAKQGLAILSMSAAILIIVSAMKKLADIDSGKLPNIIALFTTIILGLVTLMFAFGAFVKADKAGNMDKAGKMLLKISAALLIMVLVIKTVSGLEGGAIIKGLTVIAAMELLVIALVKVSQFAGQHASKAGTMLLKISIALLIMVGVIKMLSGFSFGDIAKALTAIAAIEILFAGIIAVSKIAGEYSSRAGTMMLMMAGALLIVTNVIKQLSELSDSDIKRGLTVILQMELMFTLLIGVSFFADKNAHKAGSMLLLMAGALLILSGVIFILTKIDPSGLDRALGAITLLEGCFIAMIYVTKYAKATKDMRNVLLTMISAIVLLSLAIIGLSFLEPSKLASSTAAIVLVMTAFAYLIKATGSIKTDAKNMIKTLGIMLVIIGALGLLVWGLSNIPNPEAAIQTAGALSILMSTMAGVMLVLSYIEKTSKVSKKALKSLAIMGLIVAEVGAIFGILKALDINPSIEAAVSLSVVLLAMSAACLIVSKIPLSGAVKGALGLAAFAGIMAGLLAALGGLYNIPGCDKLVQDGGKLLSSIGYALGNFVGSIIGGFTAGATSGLPEVGENLANFMKNVTPFIEGIKGIDENTVNNVGLLAGAILAFAGGDFMSSVASIISEDSLSNLGKNLSEFWTNAGTFFNGIENIGPDVIESSKALSEVILNLTNSQLTDQVTKWLGGSSDMNNFANKLVPFGEAMVSFSSIVSGNIDSGAVTAAANAGKTMAEMANTLPSDPDSVMGFFDASIDMEEFGNKLVPFGKAMVAFSDVVNGRIDSSAVEGAANAGKTMAELADSLPTKYETLLGLVNAKMDMEEFGNKLVPFGNAMVTFSSIVNGRIDSSAVESAANAGKTMAELANNLPRKYETLTGLIDSDINLEEFGNTIVPFGTAMAMFSSSVSGANFNENAVKTAATAASMLSALANNLPRKYETLMGLIDSNMDLSTFGKQIVELGKSMVSFSNELTGGGLDQSAVQLVVDAVSKIVDAAKILSEGSVSIQGIQENLNILATSMVDFSSKVSGNVDSEAIMAVTTAGKTLSETAAIMPEEVDMARITNGLNEFGQAIVDFSNVVKDQISMSDVLVPLTVGKSIAEMVSMIPTDLNLEEFNKNLRSLGDAIVEFGTDTKDNLDATAIVSAVEAGELITGFMVQIPACLNAQQFIDNTGNLAKAIVAFSDEAGDNIDYMSVSTACYCGKLISDFMNSVPAYKDITDFINKSDDLAKAVVNFSNEAKEKINIYDITKACTCGKLISDFMNSVPAYKDITDFIDKSDDLARAVVNFSNEAKSNINYESVLKACNSGKAIVNLISSIPGYSNVNNFIETLPKLSAALKSFSSEMDGYEAPDLSSVIKNFKNMASTGINALTLAFEGDSGKMKNTGIKLVMQLAKGIESNGRLLKLASAKVANDSVSSIKNVNKSFYSAGAYLVKGFAAGITAYTYLAKARSKAMASAAASAARAELDEHSPSKVGYEIGDFFGLAFVNAIGDYETKAYSAGSNVANSAKNGLSNAISRIKDAINSDIDMQPTIRPVLDLSDVESRASAINGMLGVGALSSVGTINTMMNRTIQNGRNNDVVSAINKLRKDLGNVGNTSYNINGITYDEGTNVSDAIKTLVRAAKVERRS